MSERPPRAPRRRLTTVREVCQEYLDRVVSGKTGGGWKTVRQRITEFMADNGDIGLDDLICDDLERWIEDRSGVKSPWTKKTLAQAIKRPFSFCWNKGLIGSHPLKGVSYSQGERGKPLSEEQFRLILRNVSAEYRRLLLFLWWTGCRPGELCALKWKSIDTEKAVAVLHEHKTAHATKEPRIICLPEKAIRLLIWIVKDQQAEQEYVFLNRHGNRWLRPEISHRLRRLRARLGLPASAKVYGCRHAYGSRLAKANTPLKTISVLMGHTNTKQSEHYIHLEGEMDHLHDALEKALVHKKKTEP